MGRVVNASNTRRIKGGYMKKIYSLGFVLIVLFAMTMSATAMEKQTNGNPNPGILPLDSKPYGLTYGEWSAKWWQWEYSIPLTQNPLIDDTGVNAANGQSGPVWFLAGRFCTLPCEYPAAATANREVNVPAGKALFFPILNVENDNLLYPSPFSEEELRNVAQAQMDTAENLEAEVDGVSIKKLESYRVKSPVFTFHIPENNIYDLFGFDLPAQDVPGAVDDGVYLMLHPLPVGRHIIHFKGDFPQNAPWGGFALDITYTINVVPGKS